MDVVVVVESSTRGTRGVLVRWNLFGASSRNRLETTRMDEERCARVSNTMVLLMCNDRGDTTRSISLQESLGVQILDDFVRHVSRRRQDAVLLGDFHFNLRVHRFFVRIVDAGESLNLTRPRGFVQSFGIPLFANLFT